MRVYILTYEPYHENSEVRGVYTDYDTAMRALTIAPSCADTPQWDDTDTWDLQEWDIELSSKTRHWVNSNPYDPNPVDVLVSQKHPKGKTFRKLGWRIEQQEI